MRTPIFMAALGLTLVGCLVGDAGTPGTGDDMVGPGSDPGPGPGPGSNPKTPALDVTLDKGTVATELFSTNMLTVTLQGSGGFAGPVTLAASVVDGGGAALPGWAVTLDKTTVDVAADGTAQAVATVKVPSQAALAGTVKIDATSSLGAKSVISQVTVANQLSLTMNVVGTTCGPSAATSLTIAAGTKVRWVNGDAAQRITIHIQPPNGGGIPGFDHEPDPGMAPGGTYVQTADANAGASTGQITWYCHAPGKDANRYTIKLAP